MEFLNTIDRLMPYLQWGSWIVAVISFMGATLLYWANLGSVGGGLGLSSVRKSRADRRTARRYQSQGILDIVNAFDHLRPHKGYLINLSETGACMTCVEPLLEEAPLVLLFPGTFATQRLARVVWSRREGERTLYGVHFRQESSLLDDSTFQPSSDTRSGARRIRDVFAA